MVIEVDAVGLGCPQPVIKTRDALSKSGGDCLLIKVDDPLIELEVEGVENEELKGAFQEQIAEKGFGVVGTLEVASETAHLPASNEGLIREEEGDGSPRKVLACKV